MSFQIRQAKEVDYENLRELWLQFIQDPDGSDLNIVPCEENARRWINFVKKVIENGEGEILVATSEEKLLGYIFYSCSSPLILRENRCVIYDLYVVPEFRGKGIGSELLKKALERIRSRGFKQVRIGVLSQNARALNLYEKFGFKEVLKTLVLNL